MLLALKSLGLVELENSFVGAQPMAQLIVGAIVHAQLFHHPQLLLSAHHFQVLTAVFVHKFIIRTGLIDQTVYFLAALAFDNLFVVVYYASELILQVLMQIRMVFFNVLLVFYYSVSVLFLLFLNLLNLLHFLKPEFNGLSSIISSFFCLLLEVVQQLNR